MRTNEPSAAGAAGDDAVARAELAALKAQAGFRALRVIYLIPHHNLTGGMKMIMEHIREMMERGHHVTAVYRGEPGTPVRPPWASTARVSAEMLIDTTESYDALVRRLRGTFDVCLVGYFTQLGELLNVWAPLLYWEQGHEHIFGHGREPAAASLDVLFHVTMSRMPCALAGVSSYVQDTLALQFNRRVHLIPNAIDTTRWCPASPVVDPLPKSVPTSTLVHELGPPGPLPQGTPARVLLVGNPTQAFKGWDVVLQALNTIHAHAPLLQVTWVCQTQPHVRGVHFPIRFVVNPPQHALPSLYAAGHDVFVFASRFEAWGMPVLEAMACGVPVITTRCFGVDDFCEHMHNCLMVPTLDWALMGRSILLLLANSTLRARLAFNGVETAKRLTWARAGDRLEIALYRTAAYFQRQPMPPTPTPWGALSASNGVPNKPSMPVPRLDVARAVECPEADEQSRAAGAQEPPHRHQFALAAVPPGAAADSMVPPLQAPVDD